jgi:signal peptidase I
VAKQPWLAVFLSNVWPGIGQIYGGNKARGITFILISVFLSVTSIVCFLCFLFFEDTATSRSFEFTAIITGFIFFIFCIYTLFDAYKTAKNYNSIHNLIPEPYLKKKPWLAAFLSYIFPGLGQCYNNQMLKGFVFIVCTIVILIYYPLFFFMIPLVLYAIKDAFDSAEKKNGSNRKFVEQGTPWVRVFVVAIIIFDLIPFDDIVKEHFLQAYRIPAGSMSPALEIGDRILIDKTSKARENIERGNIVVFIYPEDRSKDFIKRVIGLSGDTIEIRNKKIYLNGVLYTDPYGVCTDDFIIPGTIQPRDNYGPVTVRPGSFFVLGDNRDQSFDSRFWGFVSKEDIKGKAWKIYWSWDSQSKRVRWDRIGMAIRN